MLAFRDSSKIEDSKEYIRYYLAIFWLRKNYSFPKLLKELSCLVFTPENMGSLASYFGGSLKG